MAISDYRRWGRSERATRFDVDAAWRCDARRCRPRQVLDAVNIVCRGSLRGAKDVRVAALIGVTSIWLCIPTAA